MRAPLLALSLLLVLAGCDRIAAQVDPLLDEVRPAIDTVGAVGKTDEEYRKADAELARALVDRRFRHLSQDEQAQIVSGAAWGAFRLEDNERARALFRRATRLAPEELLDWRLLAIVETRLDHHPAAVQAMLAWLKGQDSLDAKQEKSVISLAMDAEPGDKDDAALLQWLYDHDWDSSDSRTGDVWLKLALAHLHRGDTAKARLAVARIATPAALVKLRSDLRFDGLYDAANPAFDPREAAFRFASRLEAVANRLPAELEPQVQLGWALLEVGLDEAALRIADETIARFEDGEEFDDKDAIGRVREIRAYALLGLGRTAEGVAAMEAAATPAKGEKAPVDETLDLAALYCDLGRGADAFAAAQRLDGSQDMNDYGRMVHASLRHCGAVLEGRRDAADQALAYLRAEHEDGESLLLRALLREGLLDEAAAAVVRRLASPKDRGDMLYALQDFRERPRLSPADAALRAQWDVLLAREDVQAALRKSGAIASYDYFG